MLAPLYCVKLHGFLGAIWPRKVQIMNEIFLIKKQFSLKHNIKIITD